MDGRTPYYRLKGKNFKALLVPFGECVHFVPDVTTNHRLNKLASKWKDGIFLVMEESSGEYFIGTADGVFRARPIHRTPDDEKYDKKLFDDMKVRRGK